MSIVKKKIIKFKLERRIIFFLEKFDTETHKINVDYHKKQKNLSSSNIHKPSTIQHERKKKHMQK